MIKAFFSGVGGMLDMVPSLVWAALVALLLVTACGEKLHIDGLHNDIKTVQLESATFKKQAADRENERAQLALQLTQQQAELTALRSAAAQKAQSELLAEKRATAAGLIVRASSRGVLNDLIDAVASRSAGGAASGDPAALGRAEKAATAFGSLLKTCRAEGDSDAGELEDLASQVRALINQYHAVEIK